MLIRRESPIPDSADGEDRWWLDHLLLDQFGIPTLVEVKRGSDTRIRREVVGQMLDYVAHSQVYWTAGKMRQMLVDRVGSPELADSRLAEHLGITDQADVAAEQIDRFWNKVEANLRGGDVRLLFVADELPPELRRLIEFLNEQFTKVEVLGVELRQYVGHGLKGVGATCDWTVGSCARAKSTIIPVALRGTVNSPQSRDISKQLSTRSSRVLCESPR